MFNQTVLFLLLILANVPKFHAQYDPETTTEDPVTTETYDGDETTLPTTTPRYVPYPNGGILVQYTKKGLDYIISMIERATVKIMRNFPIPDATDESFSITKIKVLKFDEPKITARFINQSGIEINTTIPKLMTSAAYSASYFFTTSGVVKSNIQNLVISMRAKIHKGATGYPSIGIHDCSGSVKNFEVLFEDSGWSTVLNSMRMFMESIFVNSMGDVFCFAARNVTSLIETVFLDFDKPMSEILKGAFAPPPGADQAPKPGDLDLKVICGDQLIEGESTGPVLKRKGAGGIASSVVAELEGLTLDMKMNDDGFFDSDQVVVGLRAGFLHNNKSSGLEPKALILDKTDRSICFAVSEAMPSSFGVQAHDNGYFVLKKKLDVADLPVEIRTPLRLLCGKCNMQFYASTSEAPKIEFSHSGVRSIARTFLRIDGRGIFNTKIKVVEAIADIETLINLYIRQNTVYGNVSLGSINVKIHDVGIGGVFDKPLNALLRKLVPKVIWPVVQKKFNKMLQEKGIKLPAVCGLSFNNTQILYTDGDMIICTDFIYDFEGFLERFTDWQMRQQGLSVPPRVKTTTLGSHDDQNMEVITDTAPPMQPATVGSLNRMDDGLS